MNAARPSMKPLDDALAELLGFAVALSGVESAAGADA